MQLFSIIIVFHLSLNPDQKSAQRDAVKMVELMEVCCLWATVKGSMALGVGAPKMKEIEEMWSSGRLGRNFQKISVSSY